LEISIELDRAPSPRNKKPMPGNLVNSIIRQITPIIAHSSTLEIDIIFS
jgi:hypothetical protein